MELVPDGARRGPRRARGWAVIAGCCVALELPGAALAAGRRVSVSAAGTWAVPHGDEGTYSLGGLALGGRGASLGARVVLSRSVSVEAELAYDRLPTRTPNAFFHSTPGGWVRKVDGGHVSVAGGTASVLVHLVGHPRTVVPYLSAGIGVERVSYDLTGTYSAPGPQGGRVSPTAVTEGNTAGSGSIGAGVDVAVSRHLSVTAAWQFHELLVGRRIEFQFETPAARGRYSLARAGIAVWF